MSGGRCSAHSHGCETSAVPEVAVILGIGRSNAYALVQRGELVALRVGGRVVIARAEIDRLLGDDPAA